MKQNEHIDCAIIKISYCVPIKGTVSGVIFKVVLKRRPSDDNRVQWIKYKHHK